MDRTRQIILASTSPRREKLMEKLGVQFTIVEPLSAESSTDPDPSKRVIENAALKTQSVASIFSEDLIIGADTVVFQKGEFFGKPLDSGDAFRMLKTLSGSTHQVFTGVTVLDTGSDTMISDAAVTHVTFKTLSDETIKAYIETGEPLDKAGAYGIQGAADAFVEELDGSWSNVVGFPMELVKSLLSKFQG